MNGVPTNLGYIYFFAISTEQCGCDSGNPMASHPRLVKYDFWLLIMTFKLGRKKAKFKGHHTLTKSRVFFVLYVPTIQHSISLLVKLYNFFSSIGALSLHAQIFKTLSKDSSLPFFNTPSYQHCKTWNMILTIV